MKACEPSQAGMHRLLVDTTLSAVEPMGVEICQHDYPAAFVGFFISRNEAGDLAGTVALVGKEFVKGLFNAIGLDLSLMRNVATPSPDVCADAREVDVFDDNRNRSNPIPLVHSS